MSNFNDDGRISTLREDQIEAIHGALDVMPPDNEEPELNDSWWYARISPMKWTHHNTVHPFHNE